MYILIYELQKVQCIYQYQTRFHRVKDSLQYNVAYNLFKWSSPVLSVWVSGDSRNASKALASSSISISPTSSFFSDSGVDGRP